MTFSLSDYLQAVWGYARPDCYLEISARVNGPAGSAAAQKKKAAWTTQHVRLGDLLSSNKEGIQPLIDLAVGDKRVDLYLGCMPLTEAPDKGRGKGDLRESIPGIWFDIDAQAPGRMESARGVPLFESPDAAFVALDRFCAEKGVRAGIVTDSGWGLHAWILLKPETDHSAEMVELVRVWNVEFAGWCLTNYGVHVDVVADRTRVLRMPETVNWRKADILDDAETVRVLRLEPETAFDAAELGWTQEFLNRLQEQERERKERLSRGIGSGSGLEGGGALFSGAAALDACSWDEILEPFGWRVMETEGSGELMRWGRPRSGEAAGEETSSAVIFADAPWVLVVFSEAAGLPSWEEIRRGVERPNTKWRTWVRLRYDGDEMVASEHAVTVALHGYPKHWPKTAAAVLAADGETFRAWNGSGSGASARVRAGVGVT